MLVIPQIFFSGDLKLAGTFHLPRGSKEKVPGVVLCHPHPLYGGNMHNNVILAANQALIEKGIAVFRFNFRGVGSSEGSFDNGVGEQNDLQAAVAALAEHQDVDPDRLGIMGYSFGGMVALAAVKSIEQVRALAAVSPVVTPGLMEGINLPAYFISGTADHVVSADLLIREAKKINPPGKVELVPGVDHLWAGHEKEMAINVAAFFKEVL